MSSWLRRVRGAIGTGLTWAFGWAPIGALVGLVVGATLGGVPLGAIAIRYAGWFAVLGLVGGAGFSAVLRIAEGRRRFDELSLPRFTIWGALGGLALGGLAIAAGLWGPGLTLVDAVILGTSTLLGAGSAAGSLALARRSADHEVLGAADTRARLTGGSGTRPHGRIGNG